MSLNFTMTASFVLGKDTSKSFSLIDCLKSIRTTIMIILKLKTSKAGLDNFSELCATGVVLRT